jgi:hypothetical protein
MEGVLYSVQCKRHATKSQIPGFSRHGEDGSSMTALPKRHEKSGKERGEKIRVRIEG